VDLFDAGYGRVARWFGEPTTAHPNLPAAAGTANVLPNLRWA
jgi:taurine dioxygenase